MPGSEPSKDYVTFLCRHCGTHSRSEVLISSRYIELDKDSSGATYFGSEYRYRLVRCSACTDLSLLLAMKVGQEGDTDYYDGDVLVYPAPPRSMSSAVPKKLQDCFLEARICYQARAYTASAIMCRRSLELLAADRGAAEKNLAQSLKKLKDNNEIDQKLFDWCDELRLAGNDAVHDVHSNVTQVDAKDMNDLAEAIIDYVYVFQARYEEFKNRRARRSPQHFGHEGDCIATS